MKFLKTAFLFLLLLPLLADGQKKEKKPAVLAIFGSARFVYVQAVDGNEFDRDLYPADRLAIADLRDALKAWGRYTLTVDREKAELVFVVRKGRLASAEVGTGVGMGGADDSPIGARGAQFPNGRQRQQGPEFGAGAEAGPPEDLLQVCQLTPNGKLSGPLWIHSFVNGLDAPRMLLFHQFKEAVEKAYPSPPPSPPAKP